MTRVFTPEGASIPVTVVQVEPNFVTQVKSKKTDGYSAVQVTTGAIEERKLKAPQKGAFEKAGVQPGRGLWEFRIEEDEVDKFQIGDRFSVDVFSEGQKVDVRGTSDRQRIRWSHETLELWRWPRHPRQFEGASKTGLDRSESDSWSSFSR